MKIDCAFFGEDSGLEWPTFIKGSEVYDTSWFNGAAKSLAEMWPDLPDNFKTGVNAVLIDKYNDGDYAFIKGDQAYISGGYHGSFAELCTEWGFTGLPDDFKTGVDTACSQPDRESGLNNYLFFKGDKVHGTYMQHGYAASLADNFDEYDWPPNFLTGIDAACCGFYNSGIFVKGDEVYTYDDEMLEGDTQKLADAYSPWPAGWA